LTEQAMTKVLVFLLGMTLAGLAQAQIKCWTGANGKRACGDLPPPGARLETPKGASAPKVPAAAEAKSGTPASAPPDQESRRPQAESRKAATKAELKKLQDSGDPRECDRAKELLRAMGGGGTSQRTDAVRARGLAQRNCS
jgi:hypothetical protein